MSKILLHINSICTSFSRLSYRDQRALLLLGGFLFLLFLWLGIWQPVENSLERSKASYLAARNDYEWMQIHASQAMQTTPSVKNSKANLNGDSLLTLVTESAQPYQIAINHAEPAEDESLNITIENVPFKNILLWLEVIQNQHHIQITQIRMTKINDKPGYVRSSLTLKRQ